MSGRPITGTTRTTLRQLLADAYLSGHTLAEIAHTYGTSEATAWRLLREAGVDTRRWGPRHRTQPTTDTRAA
jgi:transposase-like protein